MEKISKELFESIMKELRGECTQGDDCIHQLSMSYVKEKLLKFTERQFPKFEMPTGWRNEMVVVRLDDDLDIQGNWVRIYTPNSISSPAFNYKQFKDFVTKCQEIVKWIDEQ